MPSCQVIAQLGDYRYNLQCLLDEIVRAVSRFAKEGVSLSMHRIKLHHLLQRPIANAKAKVGNNWLARAYLMADGTSKATFIFNFLCN